MEKGNIVRDSNTIRKFVFDSGTKEVDIVWGEPTQCHMDRSEEQVWVLADNGRYLNEAFKQNWEFGEKNIHFEEGGYIVDNDTDMVLGVQEEELKNGSIVGFFGKRGGIRWDKVAIADSNSMRFKVRGKSLCLQAKGPSITTIQDECKGNLFSVPGKYY